MRLEYYLICERKSYLPKDVLLQLYHAFIYSHLTHAISVWESTYKNLRKTVALQNKAVKTIMGYKIELQCKSFLQLSLNALKLNEILN